MPHWMGENISLSASVEPSGIQISGKMPNQIWDSWYKSLKERLTAALGYEIGEPEEGFQFTYWTPFIKSYSDIKSINQNAITFNDFSTFYFNEIGNGNRDITANPPYFLFATDYIELRIIFNKTGLQSKRENEKDFHELYNRLCEVGCRTRDLS